MNSQGLIHRGHLHRGIGGSRTIVSWDICPKMRSHRVARAQNQGKWLEAVPVGFERDAEGYL